MAPHFSHAAQSFKTLLVYQHSYLQKYKRIYLKTGVHKLILYCRPRYVYFCDLRPPV